MEKTLLLAEENVKYKICNVVETNDALILRYAELGICRNQQIEILNKNKNAMLICVRDCVFAVDNVVASKVVVHE